MTLPEPPPAELDVPGMPESGPCERTLPFTLGLVLPDRFDEGAAARIYDDTGWTVAPAGTAAELRRWAELGGPGDPEWIGAWRDDVDEAIVLPVGHLVAVARVTDVVPLFREGPTSYSPLERYAWNWHLSGAAVVDDPSHVDVPADRTVWPA